MRSRIRLQSAVTCACMLILAACAAVSGEDAPAYVLDATVLASGNQCLPATDTRTATWIDSPQALDHYLRRCRAHRLGARPDTLPDVDFNRFGVLALEMGQQPSAGYGFDPAAVTAVATAGTAVVGVIYHEPAPGAVTAQMLTRPWILIRLPAGNFHTVRVVDQNDRPLAHLAIPSR